MHDMFKWPFLDDGNKKGVGTIPFSLDIEKYHDTNWTELKLQVSCRVLQIISWIGLDWIGRPGPERLILGGKSV